MAPLPFAAHDPSAPYDLGPVGNSYENALGARHWWRSKLRHQWRSWDV